MSSCDPRFRVLELESCENRNDARRIPRGRYENDHGRCPRLPKTHPPERLVRRNDATRRVVVRVRPVPLQHLDCDRVPSDGQRLRGEPRRPIRIEPGVNDAAIHGNRQIGDIGTSERPLDRDRLVRVDAHAKRVRGVRRRRGPDESCAGGNQRQCEKSSLHRAALRGTETPGAGLEYGGRRVAKPSDGERTLLPQRPKRWRVFGASRPSDRRRQDVRPLSLP